MTLPDIIRLLETRKLTYMPEVLLQADYDDLFRYFAYELLSSSAWVNTDARIDYFYFSQRRIHTDNILQGEACQYACLLYNDIHLEAPMRVLSPYQKIMIDLPLDIETPEPMLDEPPYHCLGRQS